MKTKRRSDELDLSKLPKWAQEHIDYLKMNLTEAIIALTVNRATPESVVVVNPYADQPQELPSHTTVQFRVGKSIVHVNVHSHGDDVWLGINSTWGPLHIEPRASNQVYIRGTK